jgi:hypothetical protein
MTPTVHLSSNLPLDLPQKLLSRLEAGLCDIHRYLLANELIATNGAVLADEKGRRYILSKMDSAWVELILQPTGEIQQIMRNGNFSKYKLPFTTRAWPVTSEIVEGAQDGEHYRIVGKYVDYGQ